MGCFRCNNFFPTSGFVHLREVLLSASKHWDTLRHSCLRINSGCRTWWQAYLCHSHVLESACLALFEVLPAFLQHFYLCMNYFTKFLNTLQQMRSICDLFRFVQDSWAENSSRIDTLHPWHDAQTGCANSANTQVVRWWCIFTPQDTWQGNTYSMDAWELRGLSRDIFLAFCTVCTWKFIYGDTLQFRLKMCLFPLSRSEHKSVSRSDVCGWLLIKCQLSAGCEVPSI